MKFSYSLLIVLILFSSLIYPQYFTKITAGPVVSNGGDSRAVNWIDYDNDNDLDLYITNGPRFGENNFFYINNGDGTFTRDTSIAIANDGLASDGTSWGDYDNDGNVDLFVANWWNNNNLLYKNNGDKTFTLITSTPIYTDLGYSETGSWGDYNRDGFIDLYVCNSETPFNNFLYKNNGNGTFTKITSGSPVSDQATSRNVDWIDYDNDGDDDIFVCNEANERENLYRNNGDGTFTRLTTGSIINSGGSSAGSSWEDFDNDGDFDVIISNWSNQNEFYFTNNGDATFTRVTTGSFVTSGGNSFCTATGDIDNDGDIDIYVANAFTGSVPTNSFLYTNNGDGTFEKITADPSANDGGWAYGCAFGDYDKDGYLDLAVGKCFNANENNALFKNNGGTNHWLTLDLEGKHSNWSAIGAVIKIKATINGKETWQMRRVAGQNGYCGQTLQIHFGLGDAVQIDSLQIRWPSGIVEKHGTYAANQFMKIVEDTTLTDVGSIDNTIPDYRLYQNYPNPFNPVTNIQYVVGKSNVQRGSQHVSLKIYDILGNEVMSLVNEEKHSGTYEVKMDGSDLSSGIYFCRLSAGDFSDTMKLTLLK